MDDRKKTSDYAIEGTSKESDELEGCIISYQNIPETILSNPEVSSITAHHSATGWLKSERVSLKTDKVQLKTERASSKSESTCTTSLKYFYKIRSPFVSRDPSICFPPQPSEIISDRQKLRKRQFFVTCVVALACVNIGITMGFSSIVITKLDHEHVRTHTRPSSWIGSSAAAAMGPGSLIGHTMKDQVGRKTSLLFCTCIFIVSYSIIAVAFANEIILIGRCFGGLACGFLLSLSPTYMYEILSTTYKTKLLPIITAAPSCGILLIHVLDFYVGWRGAVVICCFFPLLTLILLLYCPESPIWWLTKGNQAKAQYHFRWLNGESVKSEIRLNDLIKDILKQKQERLRVWESLKLLTDSAVWKPTFLVLFCFTALNCTGYMALVFYPENFVKAAVKKSFLVEPFTLVILIDVLRIITGVLSFYVVHLFTRRFLAICGGVLSSMVLFTLAFHQHFAVSDLEPIYSILPMMALLCYITFITLFLVPLPWLMCSELIPMRAREISVALALVYCLFCYFLVTHNFLFELDSWGASRVFALCGLSVLICTFFLSIFLPETKNKHMDVIGKYFQ